MRKPDILKDYQISDCVLADGSVYVDFVPRGRGLIQERPLNVPATPSCELLVVAASHGHLCIWQCEPPRNIQPAQFEATAIARAKKLRTIRRTHLGA